jgi:hypothetical protein
MKITMRILLIPFLILFFHNFYGQDLPKLFACADYTQGKVFIFKNGKVVWDFPAPDCNDIWVLQNGNILFTTGHGVLELTFLKDTMFHYESKSEIYACQRLSNSSTFIGECNSGHLLEIASNGKIIRLVKLLPDSNDGGHAYMRNARKLRNGNYLVAHYGLDKVCEYDSSGMLVMEIPVKGGPHSVIRLPNGNTLISCTDHDGEPKAVEVDRAGTVVWQLLRDELDGIDLKFLAGMQVLPNGNMVFTNWLGHNQFGTAPHAFEVTREKKVIWIFNDHTVLRTMSSIQLLNELDNPLIEGALH